MNSSRIFRNTAWYGLESAISFISSLVTSIAIARSLGPAQMGYIIYVTWITSIVSSLGSIGIPATARKYMAEYLGAGDYGTARHIYLRTLLLQVVLSTVLTAGSFYWIWKTAPAEFRLAAVLLILSIWPAMVNFISAQANVAAEKLSANLPASVISTLTFFITIMLTLWRHWGVVGVASAMLAMRSVDFLVRLFPTMKDILGWKSEGELPSSLNARMITFAWQSLTGMVLTIIVWDRSELFLLKHLSTDIRQIAFYSVAFNLAERLLVFPTVFAGAVGATIYAQYGRDRSKLSGMVAASARYLGLASIPIHFIAVGLAGAAVLALYGKSYAGAIAVATAAPILCLPKAFLGPIQSLFESTEEQKFLIWATIGAACIDGITAWLLIPAHGALGACIASGLAQAGAIAALWFLGIIRYRIQLPWSFFMRVTTFSVIASMAAYFTARALPALVGLIVGGCVGISLFLIFVFKTKTLQQQDWSRVNIALRTCPPVLSAPFTKVLLLLGTPLDDLQVESEQPEPVTPQTVG